MMVSERKFTLACGFSIVGSIGLFTRVLTGQDFIYLTGLVLALYGGANVAAAYVTKKETSNVDNEPVQQDRKHTKSVEKD